MNELTDLSSRIHDWVQNTFPVAKQLDVGLDDSLLDSGIIDSLGTLEVVQFLEAEFGIQISDEDLVADHFESVHAIAKFVESKREI